MQSLNKLKPRFDFGDTIEKKNNNYNKNETFV